MNRRLFIRNAGIVAGGVLITGGNALALNSTSIRVQDTHSFNILSALGKGLGAIGQVMTVLEIIDIFNPGTKDWVYDGIKDVVTDVFSFFDRNNYERDNTHVLQYHNDQILIPAINRANSKKVMAFVTPQRNVRSAELSDFGNREITTSDTAIQKILSHGRGNVNTKELILPRYACGRNTIHSSKFVNYTNLKNKGVHMRFDGSACIGIETSNGENLFYCV